MKIGKNIAIIIMGLTFLGVIGCCDSAEHSKRGHSSNDSHSGHDHSGHDHSKHGDHSGHDH